MQFDNKLVEYAVAEGATLIEGIAVKDFEVSEDKVSVKLRNGDELSGEVIIGAGGSYDLVSKELGKLKTCL